MIAGWKEYRSVNNKRVRAPCAEHPRRRSVGPFSRLIQGVQGAKSLDATSRWCRPPWMAGEQGWPGAAMRANLDVKHETQRASAGAHRVACFESPACPSGLPVARTHPGPTFEWPWPALFGARKCVHTHLHTDRDQ